MSSSIGASEERIDLERVRLTGDSSSTISSRLQESLTNCSKYFASGDYGGGDEAIADVVQLLNDIAERSPSASEIDVPVEALSEILEFLSSPSADEMTIDALSMHLPKSVIKFVGVSDECRKYVAKILDFLVTNCNPRDMLSMLCEALDSQIKVSTSPIDFIIFLGGLSRVIARIRRHHFHQIKVVLPVIFKVVCAVSSEFNGDDEISLVDLLRTVNSIGLSIQSLCDKLERESREKLCALLGLFTLQNMAFLSTSNLESKGDFLVRELSLLLPFCGLSYLSLINGDGVESINQIVCGEEEEDLLVWLSWVKDGACLAVLWGFMCDEVAEAAGERVGDLLGNLGANSVERWKAIGMLKHVFSSTGYSWKIKARGVELVLNIMDAVAGEEQDKDCMQRSFLIPGIFASLQGLEKVMVLSADPTLRKKAFSAFRKVVSDVPGVQRFDVLKALIKNCSSPDMIGLLLDLVRDEVHKEGRKTGDEAGSTFWTEGALELVEMILRPPKGGPPSFPQDGVPVLAALNLYRFVLLRASAARRSQGNPVTATQLRKAYSEWLLPLRAVVTGIESETRKDGGELALHGQCSLNPLQLVLYRCIELVEDSLKQAQ